MSSEIKRGRPRGYTAKDVEKNYPGDDRHFCSVNGPGCLFRWHPSGFFPDGIMVPVSWDHPSGWSEDPNKMVPVCVVCHQYKEDTGMNIGYQRGEIPNINTRDIIDKLLEEGTTLSYIGKTFVGDRKDRSLSGKYLVLKYRKWEKYQRHKKKKNVSLQNGETLEQSNIIGG